MGLVHYPTTAAPETGTIDVTTQCVENAEQTSSSLTVTCDSSGEWSTDNPPQCKCQENFNQIGDDICRGRCTQTNISNIDYVHVNQPLIYSWCRFYNCGYTY